MRRRSSSARAGARSARAASFGQQMRRHDLGEHPRRAWRQRGTPHQRLVPVGVIHRAGHQGVERRLADLRRPVGEQRPDGPLSAVAAIASDTAGARSARRATAITVPADGAIATRATRSSVVSSGDSRMTGSLTELSVSAASRRISRSWRVRQFLDRLGDDGAHPHRFVGDQRVQRLPGLAMTAVPDPPPTVLAPTPPACAPVDAAPVRRHHAPVARSPAPARRC